MIHRITSHDVRQAVDNAFRRFGPAPEQTTSDPTAAPGIAVCTADGEIVAAGDSDYRFRIGRIADTATALLALQQSDARTFLDRIRIGAPHPSPRRYECGFPSLNPLSDAGALAVCSMIRPTGDADAKWRTIAGFIESLCGSPVERPETHRAADPVRWRELARRLKKQGLLHDEADLSTDLCLRQRRFGVTARQLAVMGASIACEGSNPVSWEELFHANLTPRIAALMATAGSGDRSGAWLFLAGIPATANDEGAVLAVIPGVMGIAVRVPPSATESGPAAADAAARQIVRYLAGRLGINLFASEKPVLAPFGTPLPQTAEAEYVR